MKFYTVWFTGNVTMHFQIGSAYSIDDAIKDYMREQNKGEAKSDRIYLKRFLELSKEDWDNIPKWAFNSKQYGN